MSRNYPKNYFHKNKVTKNFSLGFFLASNGLFGMSFVRIHEILSDSMKVYEIFMFGYFKYYFSSLKIIIFFDFIFIYGENNNYYIYFIK